MINYNRKDLKKNTIVYPTIFYNYFFLKENRNQRFSFLNLIFKKYERVQESRSDLIGEMEDWS